MESLTKNLSSVTSGLNFSGPTTNAPRFLSVNISLKRFLILFSKILLHSSATKKSQKWFKF